MDDLLVMGKDKSQTDEIFQNISKEIKITDMGSISTFLGNEIDINYDEKSIFIH